MPESLTFPSSISKARDEYHHPVSFTEENPSPLAHYSTIIVGGGGVSTRGGCYDDDAAAVYCSSGPHL